MIIEQIVVNEINKCIDSLGPMEQEACRELVDFFKMNMKRAGEPVGQLAIALIGAELQLDNAKCLNSTK